MAKAIKSIKRCWPFYLMLLPGTIYHLQLNLYYKWGNSFVRPEGRGQFSARNEAISLGIGVLFTLVMGNLVDHYERAGRLETSFLIIACVIAALAVIDLCMLLMIK